LLERQGGSVYEVGNDAIACVLPHAPGCRLVPRRSSLDESGEQPSTEHLAVPLRFSCETDLNAADSWVPSRQAALCDSAAEARFLDVESGGALDGTDLPESLISGCFPGCAACAPKDGDQSCRDVAQDRGGDELVHVEQRRKGWHCCKRQELFATGQNQKRWDFWEGSNCTLEV